VRALDAGAGARIAQRLKHAGARCRIGGTIFIEQVGEIACELIVKHANQCVGLRGLRDLEEAFEAAAIVVLLDQPRDRALREGGELGFERAERARSAHLAPAVVTAFQ
jgi:hypothetical protein